MRGLPMIRHIKRALAVFPLVLMSGTGAVLAASSPVGTWIDHTGRGAVEITDCNGALCGRVVWVKDAKDEEGCNLQIIGNVKPVAGGKWDGGWIYDPERQSRYDVELTPIGDRKLRVHGYAGMKLFGETMTWTRAPADLAKCGKPGEVQAEAARPTTTDTKLPAPEQKAEQSPPGAPAPAPERDANPRTGASSEPNGSNAPLQFSERETSSKQKVCTVRLMDFGKFSFPC